MGACIVRVYKGFDWYYIDAVIIKWISLPFMMAVVSLPPFMSYDVAMTHVALQGERLHTYIDSRTAVGAGCCYPPSTDRAPTVLVYQCSLALHVQHTHSPGYSLLRSNGDLLSLHRASLEGF